MFLDLIIFFIKNNIFQVHHNIADFAEFRKEAAEKAWWYLATEGKILERLIKDKKLTVPLLLILCLYLHPGIRLMVRPGIHPRSIFYTYFWHTSLKRLGHQIGLTYGDMYA